MNVDGVSDLFLVGLAVLAAAAFVSVGTRHRHLKGNGDFSERNEHTMLQSVPIPNQTPKTVGLVFRERELRLTFLALQP